MHRGCPLGDVRTAGEEERLPIVYSRQSWRRRNAKKKASGFAYRCDQPSGPFGSRSCAASLRAPLKPKLTSKVLPSTGPVRCAHVVATASVTAPPISDTSTVEAAAMSTVEVLTVIMLCLPLR